MANGEEELAGRVLVLENDNKRHEKNISELWDKVSEHDICVASLPKIEKSLETMGKQLTNLDNCRITEETRAKEAKSKISFWDSKWGDRLWTIIASIAAVIGTLLAAMALHINFGG